MNYYFSLISLVSLLLAHSKATVVSRETCVADYLAIHRNLGSSSCRSLAVQSQQVPLKVFEKAQGGTGSGEFEEPEHFEKLWKCIERAEQLAKKPESSVLQKEEGISRTISLRAVLFGSGGEEKGNGEKKRDVELSRTLQRALCNSQCISQYLLSEGQQEGVRLVFHSPKTIRLDGGLEGPIREPEHEWERKKFEKLVECIKEDQDGENGFFQMPKLVHSDGEGKRFVDPSALARVVPFYLNAETAGKIAKERACVAKQLAAVLNVVSELVVENGAVVRRIHKADVPKEHWKFFHSANTHRYHRLQDCFWRRQFVKWGKPDENRLLSFLRASGEYVDLGLFMDGLGGRLDLGEEAKREIDGQSMCLADFLYLNYGKVRFVELGTEIERRLADSLGAVHLRWDGKELEELRFEKESAEFKALKQCIWREKATFEEGREVIHVNTLLAMHRKSQLFLSKSIIEYEGTCVADFIVSNSPKSVHTELVLDKNSALKVKRRVRQLNETAQWRLEAAKVAEYGRNLECIVKGVDFLAVGADSDRVEYFGFGLDGVDVRHLEHLIGGALFVSVSLKIQMDQQSSELANFLFKKYGSAVLEKVTAEEELAVVRASHGSGARVAEHQLRGRLGALSFAEGTGEFAELERFVWEGLIERDAEGKRAVHLRTVLRLYDGRQFFVCRYLIADFTKCVATFLVEKLRLRSEMFVAEDDKLGREIRAVPERHRMLLDSGGTAQFGDLVQCVVANGGKDKMGYLRAEELVVDVQKLTDLDGRVLQVPLQLALGLNRQSLCLADFLSAKYPQHVVLRDKLDKGEAKMAKLLKASPVKLEWREGAPTAEQMLRFESGTPEFGELQKCARATDSDIAVGDGGHKAVDGALLLRMHSPHQLFLPKVRTVNVVQEEGEEPQQCIVCLEDIESAPFEAAQLWPCGHVFHRHCVSKWVDLHSTCPLCRAKIELH